MLLGRNALLTVNGSVVVCFRTLTPSINAEPLDATDSCSDGFRELARSAGQKNFDLSVEGIAKNALFRAAALNSELRFENAVLQLVDGDSIFGDFMLSDFSETMPYNDLTTFSATLQLTSGWIYVPAGSSSEGPPVSSSSESLSFNRTSNLFWENWVDGDIVYTWAETQWEHVETDIATDFGLQVTGSEWAGFRTPYLKIILNSGPDLGNFGFLTSQNIFLRNTADTIIASHNWTFPSYNTDYTVYVAIDNSANLDYAALTIESFIYNTGPIIKLIEFTHVPPYYVLFQDGIDDRYAVALNPDLSLGFSIGAGEGAKGYGIALAKAAPEFVAFAAFNAAAPDSFPVLETENFQRVSSYVFSNSPTSVAVSHDQLSVLFSYYDIGEDETRVIEFDPSDNWSNNIIITIAGMQNINAMSFSPDGEYLAVSGQFHTRVYSTNDWTFENTLSSNYGSLSFNDWSSDGAYLAIAVDGDPGNVNFSIYETGVFGTPVSTGISASPGQGVNYGLKFSNNNYYLAVGVSSPPFLRVFNVSDWSEITLGGSINLTSPPIAGLAWSPDDSILYVSSADAPHVVGISSATWEQLSDSGMGLDTALSNGIAILRNY